VRRHEGNWPDRHFFIITYVSPMLHRTKADWHANVLIIPSPELHFSMRLVQCGTTPFMTSYVSSETTWMWCELFQTISGYHGYCS
jgi:hypothetical protein